MGPRQSVISETLPSALDRNGIKQLIPGSTSSFETGYDPRGIGSQYGSLAASRNPSGAEHSVSDVEKQPVAFYPSTVSLNVDAMLVVRTDLLKSLVKLFVLHAVPSWVCSF